MRGPQVPDYGAARLHPGYALAAAGRRRPRSTPMNMTISAEQAEDVQRHERERQEEQRPTALCIPT